MASVAVIQGANGALGSAFIRNLLRTTSLHVVGTSRNPAEVRSRIEDEVEDFDETRLTMLPMDLLDEMSIAAAAKSVEDKFGKASLRLLLNVSGVVSLDRSRTRRRSLWQ